MKTKECESCGGDGGDYPVLSYCSKPISQCCGGCTGDWEPCESCGGSGELETYEDE